MAEPTPSQVWRRWQKLLNVGDGPSAANQSARFCTTLNYKGRERSRSETKIRNPGKYCVGDQQMYDFTVRRSVFIRVRTRTNRTNSQFFGTDNALKLRLLSSVLPIVFSAIFCKPD